MKLTLRQIRFLTIYLMIVVFVAGFSYRLAENRFNGKNVNKNNQQNYSSTRSSTDQPLDLTLFWDVYEKLNNEYLKREDIDKQKLVNGAISGMVAALEDPYTVFLPPNDNKDSKDDLRGDFEGVGIQIGYNKDQKISVIAPLSGTPAEAAGVKAGDLILKIVDAKNNIDKDTEGLSLPEAVKLIRGPKGTSVKLLMARDGEKSTFEKVLRRDTIVVRSVENKFVEKNGKTIAVLKLSRFGERTDQEWQEAVDKIKTEETQNKNFAGVVLDLRNNPGGFLEGSVFIGSEFMKDGIVVKQDSGKDQVKNYEVNRVGKLLNEPVVVLINNGSASAAEIVAGTLQEIKRAKLVGETTFGKGTIQQAEDLSGGAGIHVTIARWLLPSGKSIDKEGVKPDFEIKPDENDLSKDLQLDKAIEILTSR